MRCFRVIQLLVNAGNRRWFVCVALCLMITTVFFSGNVSSDCGSLYNPRIIRDGNGNELSGADYMARTKNNKFLYVTAYQGDALSAYKINMDGSLTRLQTLRDGGGHALDGANHVDVSPNDGFLYVTAPNDHALSYYRILTNGFLSAPTIFRDGEHLNGNGTVQELSGADGVRFSDDGYLYVTAYLGHAISIYKLNQEGLPVSVRVTNNAGSSILAGPNALAIRPGGRCLYVTARDAGTLLIYSIGGYSYRYLYNLRTKRDNSTHGAISITIDGTGRFLYLSSFDSSTITVWEINSNCSLTKRQTVTDGHGHELSGACGTVLSEKGDYLYVMAFNGDAITRYEVDSDGLLSYPEVVRDGAGHGLNGANEVILGAGGAHLYVTAFHEAAVTAYDIRSIADRFPFLSQNNHTLSTKLVNEVGAFIENPLFHISYKKSDHSWQIRAEVDEELSEAFDIQPPAYDTCDNPYAVTEIALPLPEWSPYPKNYSLVIAPLRKEGLDSGQSFNLAGWNNIDSSDENGEPDYFIVGSTIKGLSVNNSSESVPPNCAEVGGQINRAGALSGQLTRLNSESGQSAIQMISGMTISLVHCLYDGQGGYQLVADTQIPLQATNQESDFARVLLTSYFEPGNSQLTWFGLEGGGDEQSVFITSIVVKQNIP